MMTQDDAAKAEAAFKEEMAKAQDWRAKCKKCGAELKGSLAEIRAHKC